MEKIKRFMFIGAHPDDPESCAGTVAKLVKAGHVVQFLSATNGNAGHYEIFGAKLTKIRYKEAQEAKKRLGIDSYILLDINDAYLTADINNREKMIKAIREFGPDYIITHRNNDYHPDHRATAELVCDCSYLVMVPNFLPLTPPPKVMPVIFYKYDSFKRPYSFTPDIIVKTDDVMDFVLDAWDAHESQVYEWLPWISGDLENVPSNPQKRKDYLAEKWFPRWKKTADSYRDLLIETYGKENGEKVKYAEAYEACEFGGVHDIEVERKIFCYDTGE